MPALALLLAPTGVFACLMGSQLGSTRAAAPSSGPDPLARLTRTSVRDRVQEMAAAPTRPAPTRQDPITALATRDSREMASLAQVHFLLFLFLLQVHLPSLLFSPYSTPFLYCRHK